MNDTPTPIPPEVAQARRATDLPADAPWWARYIESNVREAWKWASVQFPVLVAVCAEIYATDPAGVNQWVQQTVPATWWPHLVAGGCLVQIALRVVNLKGKP